jgi:phosphatidylglycerophosphatase A
MTPSQRQPPPRPGEEPAARLDAGAWTDPAVLIVTGFGSGFLKPAPGTWGTVVALGLWWLFLAELGWVEQLAVVAGTFAVGTWLTHRVGRRYGVHDDPGIVVDEFAGLWLTLVAAPPGLAAPLAGFVLFRFIDVMKPWPVSWVDRRVPGALGVMLDDLLAGGLALAVLQLAFQAVAWPGAALAQ